MLRICQTEDATRRQVQALRPESTDCNDSTPLHHINEFPKRAPGQASGAGEDTDPTGAAGPAREVAQDPRETTGTVQRLHVITVAKGPTKPERSAKP